MQRSSRTTSVAAAVGLLVAPAIASACPDCDTARIVRAAVLDEHFWSHLLLLSLPLLVLAAVSAILYRIDVAEAPPRLRPSAPDKP